MTVPRLRNDRTKPATPVTLSDCSDRLSPVVRFGSNPGALRGWTYRPKGLQEDVPLVVAFHGAMQTAAGYDRGAGWSSLADRYGFALLLPEQTTSNNLMKCFNWYGSADNQRSGGEALSVRQMVDAICQSGGIDRTRIFATGLSSGGAMTAVMLATYPETFAGGAIIAGLPYGSAKNVFQAMDRMNGLGGPSAADLEASLRGASSHDGPWPTLSIWHGTADRIVDVSNVEAIAGQWRALHRVDASNVREEVVEGYPRRSWSDACGREVVEVFSITGMGHGAPLRAGVDGLGVTGAYMLEARISSTLHIARFWRIVDLPIERTLGEVKPTPADGRRSIVEG